MFVKSCVIYSVSCGSKVVNTLHCGCKSPGSNPGHSIVHHTLFIYTFVSDQIFYIFTVIAVNLLDV